MYIFEAERTQCISVYKHKNLNVGVIREKQSCRRKLHWSEGAAALVFTKTVISGTRVRNERAVYARWEHAFAPGGGSFVCE